jgi:hypothetical protein
VTARALRLRYSRLDVALVLFAAPAIVMAVGLATVHERPIMLIVVPILVAALLLRKRPLAVALAMVGASIILRVGYIGIGYSTQIDNARNAAERAAGGLSPYGVLLGAASAPPEPYVYGPLGLLWWQPGVAVEFVAAIAVMLILVACRAWLTLALYAGLPFAVYLTTTGVNDYSPGLLIVAGLLLLRTHRYVGAGVLALAASVKPYAFAWFIPAAGFGGWGVAAVLAAISALLWSPLLVWGPSTFGRSLSLVGDLHPEQANALNLPILRWLAVPLELAGAFVRRWDAMVLLGSAVFCVFLFLDRWASLGYWLAVLPAAGIAVESRWSAPSGGRLLPSGIGPIVAGARPSSAHG